MVLLPEFNLDVFKDDDLRPLFLNAVRSLERLDSVLGDIPNVDLLVESVPLQESRLSCRIENIVTSQDEVFRAYSTGEGRSEAGVRDVLGYHKAVSIAEDGELSAELMERVCSAVKGREMRIRSSHADHVELVTSDGNVVFSPPDGEEVPGLLDEIIEFAEDESYDPLMRMIIFHAYFEIIHPFKDGNGRTGRILNEVILHRYCLLRRPVLNLSRFLIEDRGEYYRCLRMVERDGDWKRYVRFMLTGVVEATGSAVKMILMIRESVEDAYMVCRKAGFSDEVVDLIYSHPYVRARHLVEAGIVSRNTASAYLHRLEDMGILKGEQAGKGRIYMNVDLFRILSSIYHE